MLTRALPLLLAFVTIFYSTMVRICINTYILYNQLLLVIHIIIRTQNCAFARIFNIHRIECVVPMVEIVTYRILC